MERKLLFIDISIHALRKESDLHMERKLLFIDISIHALRKESDSSISSLRSFSSAFQSTLSVRRATSARSPSSNGSPISIHALRKESDALVGSLHVPLEISIHALRKESDPVLVEGQTDKYYISIHALRKESDLLGSGLVVLLPISIHALRKESDRKKPAPRAVVSQFQSTLSVRRATVVRGGSFGAREDFNPRSP